MAAPTGTLNVDPDVAKGFERYLDDTEPQGASPQARAARTRAENAREEEGNEPPAPPEDAPQDDLSQEAQPPEDDEQEGATTGDEPVEAQGEAEEEYINTLSDLAKTFEIEESDFLEHFQVQGQDGESVSLATVIDSYRTGPSLDAAVQSEIEATRTKLNEAHDTRMNELSQLTQQLVARVQNQREPDGGWDSLRASDPGEYIRLQELQAAERMDAQRAIETMERERQERESEQDRQYGRYVEEEKGKLYRLRPDWKDPARGRAAYEDINQYLDTYHFSDEQKAALVDANSINTVWKAAQYDKLQASKKGLQKRLRKLPAKHVAASARDESAPQREQQKARQAMVDKFKKSGRIEDAAELFKEHV